MNAYTEITPAKLPVTDDVDTEFEAETDFGSLGGEMLINYDEAGISSGDETYPTDVQSAEIVGLHIGGNVMISRDALVAITSSVTVAKWEQMYFEKRRELAA